MQPDEACFKKEQPTQPRLAVVRYRLRLILPVLGACAIPKDFDAWETKRRRIDVWFRRVSRSQCLNFTLVGQLTISRGNWRSSPGRPTGQTETQVSHKIFTLTLLLQHLALQLAYEKLDGLVKFSNQNRISTLTAGTGLQEAMCSLIEVLHEAPALVELLPRADLKNLSATCRSLRTLFRKRVKVIILPYPPDAAANIHSATWPQLMIIACNLYNFDDGLVLARLQTLLSPEWECMMQISVGTLFPTLDAILLRPHQQEHNPLTELSSQHCAALSSLVDKHRQSAQYIRLEGPFVGCSSVQSLAHGFGPELSKVMLARSPQLGVKSIAQLIELRFVTFISITDNFLDAPMLLKLAAGWPQLRDISLRNNRLDAGAISALTHAKWRWLRSLDLSHTPLGIAEMQHLVSWSLPSLECLCLENVGIDGPAALYLAQGQWPGLRDLDLYRNNIGTTGISYLVQSNWPLLTSLHLSSYSLNEEAYKLLGIAHSSRYAAPKLEDQGGAVSFTYNSCLHQFAHLKVRLN